VWTRDQSQVVTWSTRGLQIWRLPETTPRLNLPQRTFVDGAIFSADETRVLSWSADDTVKLWDTETGEPLLSLRHIDWVEGAAFSADESRIISWAYDSVLLWQADGAKLAEFRHEMLVMGAAWNSDESRVLSWSWDETARVWDSTNLTPSVEPTPKPQEGQGPGDL
jgi:WD40 repeat protein